MYANLSSLGLLDGGGGGEWWAVESESVVLFVRGFNMGATASAPARALFALVASSVIADGLWEAEISETSTPL